MRPGTPESHVRRNSRHRDLKFLLQMLRAVTAMCAVAALSHGLAGAAHGQTPPIPLPANLKVDLPAADVPANIARFAGAWAHGAWDGMLPHVLIVESVDGTGRAQVVYAVGDFS